jgi:hypothetical protein
VLKNILRRACGMYGATVLGDEAGAQSVPQRPTPKILAVDAI